jgi:phosphoglycerol transferase
MRILKSAGLLAIPLFAATYAALRVKPVLPAVMMDEYFYSIESRFTPFAEQTIPNFLFSSLYSSTNLCGQEFYSCGKGINYIFFILTLTFVFLIAKRLLGFAWGVMVSTVAALSPIHVYVSYFMPEAMYFALITATIYVALIAGEKHKYQWWLATGAMLGLSALTKPHAIFAVPAFILFAILISARSGGGVGKSALAGLSSLGSFALVKFGGGFAFAGVAGLAPFGSSYESSLNDFVSENAQAQSSGNSAPAFLNIFIPHSLAHLALMLTIAGMPLLLSVSVVKDAVFKKREISAASQFLVLIGLLSVTFAVVIGAFEGIVTTLGDDHSSRLITRYYEFLVPLLLIAACVFTKFVEPKIRVRTIQSLILISGMIFAWVYLSGIQQSFADSILLSGYLSSPAVLPFVALIGILVSLVWLFSAEFGSKLVVYVATPLVLLVAGFSSQSYLLSQVGTQPAYFGLAGQQAKQLLTDIPGNKISILGPVRYQNFTTKFWIDKPGIQDTTLPDGETMDAESIPNVDYVVLIGHAKISGSSSVLGQGEGFKILMLKHQ